MAATAQLRGMLLEEIVLKFLEGNGYRSILDAGSDPTLENGPAGIEVVGRGTRHQIDAIADYRFSPPFSQRYRLLVEGKSLKGAVGLATVRNALGVVRDVSEVWDVRSQPRFHYQYAIFCDTRFTAPAQDYAFVQDIFLLPLGQAATMRPVLTALREMESPAPFSHMQLKIVRTIFRESLRNGELPGEFEFLRSVVDSARAIGAALIGMALNGMPLFLVPEPGLDTSRLSSEIPARVTWEDGSWSLATLEGARLFSFDLPDRVFARHAEREAARKIARPAFARDATSELRRGEPGLTPDGLSDIQVSVFSEGTARVIRFVLDGDWTVHVCRCLGMRADVEHEASVTA